MEFILMTWKRNRLFRRFGKRSAILSKAFWKPPPYLHTGNEYPANHIHPALTQGRPYRSGHCGRKRYFLPTVAVSRMLWKELPNHKLDTVAGSLGYDFMTIRRWMMRAPAK